MTDLPLSALRAYQALARCGSFTAAARDLGCAQSAVSRQIATLEAHLQQTLVLRGHRRVQLTQAGMLYLETVQRVLAELEQGAQRLSRPDARPVVKILSMPSFAARWLLPRCTGLREARIEVQLELATSIWDADFHRERFDLAVHYGDGAWPGAQLLMHDSLVPVAAPRLVGADGLQRIDDLARFCWLHDSLRSSKWPQWLATHGVERLAGERDMKLQDAETTLSAAVSGLGIAMGHAVLVENDLREGRLVRAWPAQVPLAAGYHLLQSRRAAGNATARALAAWLLAEAEAFRQTNDPARPAP